MQELLLASSKHQVEEDDHDLPFPAGTPFKGVVRSSDFINGPTLAQRIGLTEGTPINNDSGWLHFVEENGYNIYIAKKPLRQQLSWEAINTAQTGKEIILAGKTFVVEFISGLYQDNVPANTANAGGAWNRYMYNVYKGDRYTSLPASKQDWGPYTGPMLGIPVTSSATEAPPGTFCWVKEVTTSSANGHATRGISYNNASVPNIMGVWYGDAGAGSQHLHYAWRPMLVEKGTTPPPEENITPFKGLVPASSFITGTALATAMGITYTGDQVINDNVNWMKIEDGTGIRYIAQKSILCRMHWLALQAANVHNGTKTITIGGKQYKVWMLSGAAGGDWDKYMYYVYDGAVTTAIPPLPPLRDRWARFTDLELNISTGGVEPGTFTLVRDVSVTGYDVRGYPNITASFNSQDSDHVAYGWRPMLIEVP